MNKRLQALEEEKESNAKRNAQGMPTPSSDLGSPQHLLPKSLFTTPRSLTGKGSAAITPETPSTVNMSDVDTLSVSSEQTSASSVTPDMSKLTLGRGRGRPCKQLVKPTFDDFLLTVLSRNKRDT